MTQNTKTHKRPKKIKCTTKHLFCIKNQSKRHSSVLCLVHLVVVRLCGLCFLVFLIILAVYVNRSLYDRAMYSRHGSLLTPNFYSFVVVIELGCSCFFSLSWPVGGSCSSRCGVYLLDSKWCGGIYFPSPCLCGVEWGFKTKQWFWSPNLLLRWGPFSCL